MARQDQIDELAINTIRTLSIDGVQKANSGHPGMPMGAATMAYVLWTRHLCHNPKNPSIAEACWQYRRSARTEHASPSSSRSL